MGKRKNFLFSMIVMGALVGSASAQLQNADQTQPQAGNFSIGKGP